MSWLALPFLAQGAVILVDEVYSHRRRTLTKQESLSHLVDSLLFLICLLICTRMPVTTFNESLYLGFAVSSSLLITKDEWIHAQSCDGFEQWLHAVLFVVHPLALLSGWWIWHNPDDQFFGWKFLPAGVLGLMILQTQGARRGTAIRSV